MPDHPVKLILYDVLYESEYCFLGEEEIYFCDHYNENHQKCCMRPALPDVLKKHQLEHEGLEQKETGLSGLGNGTTAGICSGQCGGIPVYKKKEKK